MFADVRSAGAFLNVAFFENGLVSGKSAIVFCFNFVALNRLGIFMLCSNVDESFSAIKNVCVAAAK